MPLLVPQKLPIPLNRSQMAKRVPSTSSFPKKIERNSRTRRHCTMTAKYPEKKTGRTDGSLFFKMDCLVFFILGVFPVISSHTGLHGKVLQEVHFIRELIPYLREEC